VAASDGLLSVADKSQMTARTTCGLTHLRGPMTVVVGPVRWHSNECATVASDSLPSVRTPIPTKSENSLRASMDRRVADATANEPVSTLELTLPSTSVSHSRAH